MYILLEEKRSLQLIVYREWIKCDRCSKISYVRNNAVCLSSCRV